jgi:hypothetical protein
MSTDAHKGKPRHNLRDDEGDVDGMAAITFGGIAAACGQEHRCARLNCR